MLLQENLEASGPGERHLRLRLLLPQLIDNDIVCRLPLADLHYFCFVGKIYFPSFYFKLFSSYYTTLHYIAIFKVA